jgi:hypothetical protein
MRVLIATLLAAAVAALPVAPFDGSATVVKDPFVLFASNPFVGHATPLALQATALWRRRSSDGGVGDGARIVVATTAFHGSPHHALHETFRKEGGEGFGTGVEYVEVGFVNVTSSTLLATAQVLNSKVCAVMPLRSAACCAQ